MANWRSLRACSAAVARLGAECFAQTFGPRFVRAIAVPRGASALASRVDRAQESKSKA
jgi:hypothetical protein